MTQEQQEKLSQDYERYKEEAASLAGEGRAIGTFTCWRYEQGVSSIKIAKTWEEHKRGVMTAG